MDDAAFDRALIAAAFEQAGQDGWGRLSIVRAARAADLPLDRARQRFPCRAAVLMRFGLLADQAALAGAAEQGTTRDRLFDAVMRRIDVLQSHRAGMLALLRWLPTQPATAAMLGLASLRSMGWMLAAAGIATSGMLGRLRGKGMLAVWLWTVRAWQADASPDLAATMAALDRALDRAEQADSSLTGLCGRKPQPEPPTPDPPPPEPTPITPDVPPTAPVGDYNAE